MIISKPVKMPLDRPRRSRLWRAIAAPLDWLEGKLYRYKKSTRRAIAYARFGWGNYDFDGIYLVGVVLFKLERMLEQLDGADAFCHHDEQSLKSLRLAIRLGKRLQEHDYNYANTRHSRKWGELEVEFIPLDPEKHNGFKGSEMRTHRANITPETEEQEREEFMAATNEDDATKTRDGRWFFSIIAENYQAWWD